MEATFRYADEIRHRAVYSVTEAESLGAKVVVSHSAVQAAAADAGCGLRGSAVALAESSNRFANLSHDAAEFMTQNHGYVHSPAVGIVILVYFAAAHPNGTALEQYFLRPDLLRLWNLAQFHRAFLQGVVNN